MLHIAIPSDGLTLLNLKKFEQFDLPAPPGGIDSETNGNLVLSFEDEQQAVDYSMELDRFSETLNDVDSPRYKAAGEIMKAIGEDEFVQAYIQA